RSFCACDLDWLFDVQAGNVTFLRRENFLLADDEDDRLDFLSSVAKGSLGKFIITEMSSRNATFSGLSSPTAMITDFVSPATASIGASIVDLLQIVRPMQHLLQGLSQ
ncbi:hypothetical protein HJC23_005047, partial [Cyclotella cryptica]